jgi:hypothetical protein
MPGTITITRQVSIVNGTFSESYSIGPNQITQANIGGGNPGTLTFGTSETDIAFTGITTPGYCTIQNLDSVNSIQLGPKNASNVMQALIKIPPLGSQDLWLDTSVTLRGKASGAGTKFTIKAYEA